MLFIGLFHKLILDYLRRVEELQTIVHEYIEFLFWLIDFKNIKKLIEQACTNNTRMNFAGRYKNFQTVDTLIDYLKEAV